MASNTLEQQIEEVADLVARSDKIIVFTGAGVSTESGIPDFRSPGGIWTKYDPDDFTIQKFLSDSSVRKKHWQLMTDGDFKMTDADPNPGHYAIAKLAAVVPKLTLVTQNVDGLHQRAGSTGVVEFHGNLFEDRCFVEGRVATDVDHSQPAPCCTTCGGYIRPGVVWFGEAIPRGALEAATTAAGNCDVFLSIGTSSLVWPAAGLAGSALERGATVVEINLEPTPNSGQSHHCLQGKSGEILPELLNCVTV